MAQMRVLMERQTAMIERLTRDAQLEPPQRGPGRPRKEPDASDRRWPSSPALELVADRLLRAPPERRQRATASRSSTGSASACRRPHAAVLEHDEAVRALRDEEYAPPARRRPTMTTATG